MEKKFTVNQYFQKPVGSGSNFFDDISSSSGSSAMMASVIESGSSHDLFQASTISPSIDQSVQLSSGIAAMQIDKSGNKNSGSQTSASSKSDETNNSKEEPVLCRIFAMQDDISNPVEKSKPTLGKTFFDTLGSTSPTSILQFGAASSGIDFMMPDPVNNILPPGLNSDGKYNTSL